MGKTPIFIKAYWDNRAGHVKQTRGILQALSKLTPIEVEDIFLPAYGFYRSIVDWTRFVFFSLGSKKNPGLITKGSRKVDLIIGTGTHTHIPMLLERKKNSARVVTCMTPEWPLAGFMDLCFIPEHDHPQKNNNIVETIGPPNTAFNQGNFDEKKGLIVIGGIDRKTHVWKNEEILTQVINIIKRDAKIFWTISTSPRTPKDLLPLICLLEKEFPNTRFLPFEKTSKGWIEDQYASSKITWVSADSVSMVYEALTAGCHVGVLSVKWENKENKVAKGIAALQKSNRILSYEKWKKKISWPPHSGLNEAGRCAKEILKRWWPDRLQ